MKKVLVSGVQSSGALHIGNYFGAIKQNIELGNSGEFEPYIFLADYHSMTSLTDAKERRENSGSPENGKNCFFPLGSW